jgi:hypothetical protein
VGQICYLVHGDYQWYFNQIKSPQSLLFHQLHAARAMPPLLSKSPSGPESSHRAPGTASTLQLGCATFLTPPQTVNPGRVAAHRAV